MAGSSDKPEPEPVESNNDRPIDSELQSQLSTSDSRLSSHESRLGRAKPAEGHRPQGRAEIGPPLQTPGWP